MCITSYANPRQLNSWPRKGTFSRFVESLRECSKQGIWKTDTSQRVVVEMHVYLTLVSSFLNFKQTLVDLKYEKYITGVNIIHKSW